MAHRGDRERERERDRDRDRDQVRDRERDRPGRADRDRREASGRDRAPRDQALNEFFVDGEGIHRDVMQREICKYLGPEAYSRPGVYNGANGYIVTAVRPFTPKMIDDLQILSEEWVSENRDLSRRGYEGVPYPQSQTSRRSDRSDPSLPGAQESPYMDSRYPPQPAYSSASGQPGYTPTAGYQQGPNYPQPQAPGYATTPGYAQQVSGYQPNPAYPQGSSYQSGPVYPTASGYSAPGYPAPVGRTGNPNDQNYTYEPPEYSNPGYQYRQPGAYPTGAQPRDPRADPRTDPRLASGYPYVSAPQDTTMRGTAIDDRYGPYGQSMPTTQAGRGGFPTPARGTPTGVYDPPPQPRDGFDREPVRDERRRR